jgi:hypothetical protein
MLRDRLPRDEQACQQARRFNVSTTEQNVSSEEIARRAYELWQARGCPQGDGSADWQAAEAELKAGRQFRNGSANGRLRRWWHRLRRRFTRG